MGRGRHGEDRGESLLEILLSIMIIGIAVTAILGGVGLAARASTQDERTIHAQSLLRSWAEHIQARTTDASYIACATKADFSGAAQWGYPSPPPAGLEALPAGFTASVKQDSDVQYWNKTSRTFGSGCDPAVGLQRVRLTMTVAAGQYPGFESTYDVVLRKPCAALATATVTGC